MSDSRRISLRFLLLASLATGLCVTAVFLGLAARSKALLRGQLLAQARAHVAQILLTRSWGAQHGGVYVIKRPGMQSDQHQENPDLNATDGRVLTLINPDLMLREISELLGKGETPAFHLTSLNPLNPHNAPDPFESQALRAFEAGQKEFFVLEDKTPGARLRYMAPLFVEQSCLSCHARQGYKAGQVRGGLSVSFGIDSANQALRLYNLTLGGLGLATMGLLLLALWLCFRQMQARLATSQALLERLSTIDPLTNVANRTALMTRLAESMARQRRQVPPPGLLGCLMLDVDQFKAVNDRFGLKQGDVVLRELAALIVGTLRKYDTFGRYGGKEFLLVLDGVDGERLSVVAERLRSLIAARLATRARLPQPVTISLGGTLVSVEEKGLDGILRRADSALAQAKIQGGNRVVLSPGLAPPETTPDTAPGARPEVKP